MKRPLEDAEADESQMVAHMEAEEAKRRRTASPVSPLFASVSVYAEVNAFLLQLHRERRARGRTAEPPLGIGGGGGEAESARRK